MFSLNSSIDCRLQVWIARLSLALFVAMLSAASFAQAPDGESASPAPPAEAPPPAASPPAPPAEVSPPAGSSPAPNAGESAAGVTDTERPAEVDESQTDPQAAAGQAVDGGRLTVLLFRHEGGPFPSGVTVETDDGASAITTDDGVARIAASAGTRTLFAVIPGSLLEPPAAGYRRVEVGNAVVVEGETTQVLVNLSASGEVVSVDVEALVTEEEAEAAASAEPEEEVVVEYGVVSGRVVSSEEKAPVREAKVLARGIEAEVTTDENGEFELKLPVGVHSVSVVHAKYSLQTTNDIKVEKDGFTQIVIELTPTSTQLDDFVVTAPFIKGGVAAVMSERRKSTTVQDALGSEDIAKSPDGSASSATRRIVGASIVGGQFLFVRGLGGRYSNVRLNGVPMPSTDPDLPGFQLDLFPTSLLSSLTIAKTFSPDIPADFAGGSLNVETRSFPEEFTLSLSASGTFNSQTTFRDVLDYQGGSTDYLGFDDGTRAMPSEIPDTRIVGRSRTSTTGLSTEEIVEIGRGFPNNWKLLGNSGLPTWGFGASVGDTLKTRAGDFGYFLTLGYKNRTERQMESFTTVFLEGPSDDQVLRERDTLNKEVGKREAQIGTLGTVSYSPVDDHSISWVTLLTQNGSDNARLITGRSALEGAPIRQTQLQWIERQLLFNQLLGQHDKLGDLLSIKWQLNMARTMRDQPDTRGVLYAENPQGDLAFRGVTGSGEHLYTELRQRDLGGGLDLTFDLFEDATAKAGYMGRTSERSFRARRFGTTSTTNTEAEDNLLVPEELFDPDQSGEAWRVTETTNPDDGYEASQDLNAGYSMLELPLTKSLRVMGGVRVESFNQAIDAVVPYEIEEDEDEDDDEDEEEEENAGADRTDLDYLPAGTLIYAITETMNARIAYGGTVARPQIRELAPFINQDFVRRRTIQGNPDLTRTFIHNFDVRWEMFPTPTEVFAVSLFYKSFEDPIESVIVNQNGDITYENIEGADNYGAEFEARVGMGLISKELEAFSAMANFAWIHSEVRLSEEQARLATSARRPLAGQSPYVANLALGFEPDESPLSMFLYYNVFGRRIQDAGRRLDVNSQGLPDVYQEAFHSLDFTAFYKPNEHWNFGFSASNLLLQKEKFTQGGLNYSEVDPGVSMGLSAGWSY